MNRLWELGLLVSIYFFGKEEVSPRQSELHALELQRSKSYLFNQPRTQNVLIRVFYDN